MKLQMITKNCINGIAVFLIYSAFLFQSSCKQNEFIPPAVGEKIPFENKSFKPLTDVIQESSANIFKTAWAKSNMIKILDSIGKDKTEFTLLIPSDQAFEKVGINLQKVNQMTSNSLDTLLLYYTIRNRLKDTVLKNRNDNLIAYTLLYEKGYLTLNRFFDIEPINNNLYDFERYFYRHALKIQDNNLFVNGTYVGQNKYVPTSTGSVYFIEKVIPRTGKTVLEILESTPKFSLFLETLKYSDELYELEYAKKNEGRKINRPSFANRHLWQKGENSLVLFQTFFFPTNKAFEKVGIKTIEDIKRFNQERFKPSWKLEGGNYNMEGQFPIDSLLDYHVSLGFYSNYSRLNWRFNKRSDKRWIYSNLFSEEKLLKKLVYSNSDFNLNEEILWPFIHQIDNNGRFLIGLSGSNQMSMVDEPNIPSLMGPIHAMDDLIIPKNFQLKK